MNVAIFKAFFIFQKHFFFKGNFSKSTKESCHKFGSSLKLKFSNKQEYTKKLCDEPKCKKIFVSLCFKMRRIQCDGCGFLQYWDPVCGSDGITYSNEGELDCANCEYDPTAPVITKVNDGECSGTKSFLQMFSLSYF